MTGANLVEKTFMKSAHLIFPITSNFTRHLVNNLGKNEISMAPSLYTISIKSSKPSGANSSTLLTWKHCLIDLLHSQSHHIASTFGLKTVFNFHGKDVFLMMQPAGRYLRYSLAL
jgi:hypothetical protein